MKKILVGTLCLMAASLALDVSALMTGAGCKDCKPADAALSEQTPDISALNVSDIHLCPSNNKCKIHSSTELIVLHIIEAPARISLEKLSGHCYSELGNFRGKLGEFLGHGTVSSAQMPIPQMCIHWPLTLRDDAANMRA